MNITIVYFATQEIGPVLSLVQNHRKKKQLNSLRATWEWPLTYKLTRHHRWQSPQLYNDLESKRLHVPDGLSKLKRVVYKEVMVSWPWSPVSTKHNDPSNVAKKTQSRSRWFETYLPFIYLQQRSREHFKDPPCSFRPGYLTPQRVWGKWFRTVRSGGRVLRRLLQHTKHTGLWCTVK